MNWFIEIFTEQTFIQAILILSLICAVGLALGQIKIGGVSLGVTFVFFAGIIAGHFGITIDAQMLQFAESFGLAIFVYSLGVQVGPGFVSSFRADGIRLNACAMGIILLGSAMAIIFSKTLSIPLSDMVGVLCGATTNTPALGASQQTLQQMGLPTSGAALSCAITYPLGVVGVILAILLINKLWVRPTDMASPNAKHINNNFHTLFI